MGNGDRGGREEEIFGVAKHVAQGLINLLPLSFQSKHRHAGQSIVKCASKPLLAFAHGCLGSLALKRISKTSFEEFTIKASLNEVIGCAGLHCSDVGFVSGLTGQEDNRTIISSIPHFLQ